MTCLGGSAGRSPEPFRRLDQVTRSDCGPRIGQLLFRLEQNLLAGDLVLTDDETAHLNEVSAPAPNEYTYGPFGVKQRDRYVDASDQAIKELF